MGGGPAAAWAEAANLVRGELRPAPGKSLRNPQTLLLGFARKYPAPERRGQLRTQEVGRSVHRSVHSCWQRPRSTPPSSGRAGREGAGSRSLWEAESLAVILPRSRDRRTRSSRRTPYGEQISAPCLPPVEPPDPTGCPWQLVSQEGTLARPPHLPTSPLTASPGQTVPRPSSVGTGVQKKCLAQPPVPQQMGWGRQTNGPQSFPY